MDNVKAFLVKNQTALLTWLGTAALAGAQYFTTHTISSADLLGVLFGLLKIIEPDLTVTPAQVIKDGGDLAAAISKPSVQTIEQVVTDAEGIVNGVVAGAAK